MAIKRVTYNTLSYLVAEIKDRYAEKSAIGALGGLDKVAVENLADDLKNLINGKANTATTLAGYGITDGMTATEIASAISTAIAGTDHLSRVMVDSTADINVAADGAEKKIYMVKNTDGEAGNLYSEYMVIDGKLEKVGDWKVDLSSYAKTTEVTAAIASRCFSVCWLIRYNASYCCLVLLYCLFRYRHKICQNIYQQSTALEVLKRLHLTCQ